MPVVHLCPGCGGSFSDKPSKARKFCSRRCEESHRVDRSYPEPAPVVGARWIAVGHGLHALVDDADFPDVARWLWVAVIVDGRTRNVTGSMSSRRVLLHRLLLGVDLVDHVNGDPLDNRRENLRRASKAQNAHNTGKTVRGHTSRFKGVWFGGGRWQAMIRTGVRRVWLGRFGDETAAAHAYDAAAREHHGAFARVNFPMDGEQSALR